MIRGDIALIDQAYDLSHKYRTVFVKTLDSRILFVIRMKTVFLMDHTTASLVFVADDYEPERFDELADKVKCGAYFPTKYGTLSISYEVAKVLFKLKVPLRASRKGYISSGVLNIEDNIKYGDCIRGGDSKLVLTVKKYMDKSDWDSFYSYLLSKDNDNISAADIEKHYSDYKSAPKRTKRR